MPSCNKTQNALRRSPHRPVYTRRACVGGGYSRVQWELGKTRAKLKPEGESIRLAPASSHPAVPAPLVRQRRRSLPGAAATPVRCHHRAAGAARCDDDCDCVQGRE